MLSVRSTPTTSRRAPLGELEGDAGGARGHVEHAAGPRRDDVVDHGPAPAAVLPHRQDLGQAVVAIGQRLEESLGEPVAIDTNGVHDDSSGMRGCSL